MKTTDEMILDLVARGFKLPEGIWRESAEQGEPPESWWCLNGHRANKSNPVLRNTILQQAHDLCAMEFARQAVPQLWHETRLTAGRYLMAGDSAGAIAALWEATK